MPEARLSVHFGSPLRRFGHVDIIGVRNTLGENKTLLCGSEAKVLELDVHLSSCQNIYHEPFKSTLLRLTLSPHRAEVFWSPRLSGL
jgi:hypothetical protein